MSTSQGEVLYGRNPILETLKAGRRTIDAIRIARGVRIEGTLEDLLELAAQKDVTVHRAPRQELDRTGLNHQGVTASASPYPYADLDQILARGGSVSPPGLILLLDMLQDPQNLGTLLRTAEAVRAAGVIIPARRSASVTPAVVRASAGASEHLLIAQHNLAQACRTMKDAGYWIVGLDLHPEAVPLPQAELAGPLGVVVGNEGAGLRRLVRESCDFLIRLPMEGEIRSLNAAVAGSIVLYAAWVRSGSGSIDAPPESW